MNPRRLAPLLGLFLVLLGVWWVAGWWQEKKAEEKLAASKLFVVPEAQINAITLKRGPEDIRLVKEGQDWRLIHPVKERADQRAAGALVAALPALTFSRDLGAGQEVKTYGLDKPFLVLTFTAGEKGHTLTLGRKTPGDQGYYAQKDQDPAIFIVAAPAIRTLDQPLNALRDRSLFDFPVDKVKSLQVKAGNTQVVLEKTGSTWRWQGQEAFKVNTDRLERLLRYLSLVRVREFPQVSSPDLRPLGLAPPAVEVTVVTDKGEQRLGFGSRQKDACYARKGEGGPVVLVDDLVLALLTSPLESVPALEKDPLWGGLKGKFPVYLAERRMWTGEVREVAALTWGSPDKPWSAVKDKEFFKITGPGKEELRQPALSLEMALLRLRELEAMSLKAPAPPEAKAAKTLELRDAQGKPLFRLEEVGQRGDHMEVRFSLGNSPPQGALVASGPYRGWQESLERLATSPLKK